MLTVSRAVACTIAVFLAACRTPTQVTVELSTDVPCSASPVTTMFVGRNGAELASRAPAVRTASCSAGGRIGSVVLVPSGAKDEPFALEVILSHSDRPHEQCRMAQLQPEGLSGCIFVRRELRFLPYSELTLPIELRRDCDGITCPARETCVRGNCVPASDPTGTADGGRGDADAADASLDQASMAAADGAGDVVDTGPGDGTGETDPWVQYSSFHALRELHFARRRIECLREAESIFNTPAEPAPIEVRLSIRLGFVEVDQKAMADCIAALEKATCNDIVQLTEDDTDQSRSFRIPAFASCTRVLIGKVLTGETCTMSWDCGSRDNDCKPGPCAGTCSPRPPLVKLGEPCDGRECEDGLACRSLEPMGPRVCATGNDLPCDMWLDCGRGFSCARFFPDGGARTCRPVQLGARCEGSWECPYTLACVGATATTPGTCQTGRSAGEPCTIQGKTQFEVFTDCGYRARCLDVDVVASGKPPANAELKCFGGSAIDGPCGLFRRPEGTEDYLECAQGFCGLGRTCVYRLPLGAICSSPDSCAPPNQCQEYMPFSFECRPPREERAVGGPCRAPVDERQCVVDAYCAEAPTPTDPRAGVCRARRKAGETCSDMCAQLTSCVLGICTKC